MLAVGSMVMYGRNGVCRIRQIAERKFGKTASLYYVLEPAYRSGLTFFVPVGQEEALNMQRVLSEEQIHELIQIMPSVEVLNIEDERLRRDTCEELLNHGNRKDVIRVIKTIYQIRQQRQDCGKKLCSKDEQLFSLAQKMLYDEFVAVLNIEPDQVVPMIIDAIEMQA